jgi:hypothetical protein
MNDRSVASKDQVPELPAELRRAAKISTSGYWAGVLLTAADEIEAARRREGETTEFRLLPIERDELIRWHRMCAQVSEQTDDFAGARRHRERLTELTPPSPKTTPALPDRIMKEPQ